MSTSEHLLERAMWHAGSGTQQDDAVLDLLECCSGRRVAAIHARQVLMGRIHADPGDLVAARALGLIDEMVHRDVWDVVA